MVEINNISKIYGSQRAVDNISFSVEGGSILGFLGPNGAGKSTTMKMITSYITPDEGSIKVDGHEVTENPLYTRGQIGYLPEHNPLYLDMYVIEYLNFVAQIHALPHIKSRVQEVLDMVGLNREAHKQIGQLSKGYRQRVGLAQALIHDPKILILDEPTSGLDMNQLQDIRQLIRELGKEKTVILSTHIMQEVQALCDRVIIINEGKLVADDPIDILTSKVKGQGRIKIVLQEEQELDLNHIVGVEQVLGEKDGLTILHDINVDVRPQIFQYCAEHKITILEMYTMKANVEDVFKDLTTPSHV